MKHPERKPQPEGTFAQPVLAARWSAPPGSARLRSWGTGHEMRKKTGGFDSARDRTAATCGRLWKGGIAIGVFGFLAGILLSKVVGWPIYGFFLGVGIFLGALISRPFIQSMAAREGEDGNGDVALKRAVATCLVLLVTWCVVAGMFDLLDEKFDIDPGHVHVFWVVAIGGALANLWLVLVSSVRIWNPLSFSAR
ncbi:MAG: hypothetical protein JSR24_02245 [Proteobacteria bacterium]|nr:hypothetical protein [Pseudomonadota bacterium]